VSAAIIAFGAVSALGEGLAAGGVGEIGARARVAIAHDEDLARAGLARPFAARISHAHKDGSDPAAVLLTQALLACAAELDLVRPGWRKERVGLSLGTSSGAMNGAMRYFSAIRERPPTREEAVGATYFAPMVASSKALGLVFAPATLLLVACAASTIAIGLGTRWLAEDACDLVIAGGFDALSVFVASGFEVLRATTATVPPRPFLVGRDGMSLGEGAAVLALVPAGRVSSKTPGVRAFVSGFGASSDAVHLTAPDRTGGGLARAGAAALADAGLPGRAVDLVSAHATATPFNDTAEARALESMLGADHTNPLIFPVKSQIGHTLGAAGALETIGCIDAMARGVLPATPAVSPVDGALPGRLLDTVTAGRIDVALKLSAAFGGANAALVITREAPTSAPARPRRAAYISRAVAVLEDPRPSELASRVGWGLDKITRGDDLVRYALAAVAKLEDSLGSLKGAGVVVGHAYATLETNRLFYVRMRERGARLAEPRRFAYTSPNAVAGECSVAFGLTGPGLAVGSGLHGAVEALAVAAQLVSAGDADALIVIGVDDVGPAVHALESAASYGQAHSGAVALLVTSAASPYARIGEIDLRLAHGSPSELDPVGHAALLPLTAPRAPASVRGSSPWGACARVSFLAV
jgi:3-oxoacyl-[acyl-carrier-protein] synthase II